MQPFSTPWKHQKTVRLNWEQMGWSIKPESIQLMLPERSFFPESSFYQHCTYNDVFVNDFFSKCDQIHRKLLTWSHLLKKSLVENFIFYDVQLGQLDSLSNYSHHYYLSFAKWGLNKSSFNFFDFQKFSMATSMVFEHWSNLLHVYCL